MGQEYAHLHRRHDHSFRPRRPSQSAPGPRLVGEVPSGAIGRLKRTPVLCSVPPAGFKAESVPGEAPSILGPRHRLLEQRTAYGKSTDWLTQTLLARPRETPPLIGESYGTMDALYGS